jgi:hypothetical protein
LNEDFAQAATRLCLQRQRFLHVIVSNETPQDKYVTELLPSIADRPTWRGDPFFWGGRNCTFFAN